MALPEAMSGTDEEYRCGDAVPEALKEPVAAAECLVQLSQVLRCMDQGRELPVWFTDLCKQEALDQAQFQSWYKSCPICLGTDLVYCTTNLVQILLYLPRY